MVEQTGTKETSRKINELGEEFVFYKCEYCGGEIISLANTVTTECIYCKRPIEFTGLVSGEFKPDVVIPFNITKEQAIQQFEKHLKGKRFIPDNYKSNQNMEKLAGLYIPFWLYDGTALFSLDGEGRMVTKRKSGNQEITKTDIYSVVRQGKIPVQNISVDASLKTPDAIMDLIGPYKMSELKPFDTTYMDGFLAERYDENRDKCYPKAERKFHETAESKLKASLKQYTSVRRNSDRKDVRQLKVKYGILPVWILHYPYKDKEYLFAMNGQTGKMVGGFPIDPKKVVVFSSIMFGIGGVVSVIVKMIIDIVTRLA